MDVGFIGLGRMGEPMAQNLLSAGHRLTVHNRSQAVVERMVAAGARRADCPADVARAAEVVVSCVLTPEQDEAIWIGPGGAIEGARPGQVFIDTSTVEPALTRRLAAALAPRGVEFIDAPISGGPDGARAGTLSVIVGGAAEALAKARPVLEVFGRRIFHMGPAGCGVSAKICNQILTGTIHALVCETMVLGTKLGLDPAQLFEVARASSGQSRALERAVPNYVLPRNFAPAYTVEGIIKDLECAIQTAKKNGVRLLLPTIAQQLYTEARGLGHGGKDVAAVVLPMEAIAGVEVRPRD